MRLPYFLKAPLRAPCEPSHPRPRECGTKGQQVFYFAAVTQSCVSGNAASTRSTLGSPNTMPLGKKRVRSEAHDSEPY